MKLNFTQKEYAKLLEMVYIAGWVAGSHDADSPAAKRYADVEQKILAAATPMGCADYVEGDFESGEELFPSLKLEEETSVRKAIEDFEDATFWDELVARLAERDYSREQLKDPLPPDASDEQRRAHMFERLGKLEERYWAEFEKHGLDNVITLFGSERIS